MVCGLAASWVDWMVVWSVAAMAFSLVVEQSTYLIYIPTIIPIYDRMFSIDKRKKECATFWLVDGLVVETVGVTVERRGPLTAERTAAKKASRWAERTAVKTASRWADPTVALRASRWVGGKV